MSDYSITATVHVHPQHRIRLRLAVRHPECTTLKFDGMIGWSLIVDTDHPDDHRLEAAVAAFNAVMDAKEVAK
jgi:hypothetical protein